MQIFYCPLPREMDTEIVILPPEEGRHCRAVLRKKVGDSVFLTDGAGGFYTCLIQNIEKDHVSLRIISGEKNRGEHAFDIGLILCLLKDRDAMEWTIEKSIELGINYIYLAITQNSERVKLNMDRIQKIAISAIKQCKRSRLPFIEPPKDLKDLLVQNLRQITGNYSDKPCKFVAFCGEKSIYFSSEILRDKSSCWIAIGPEGDFTEEEINLFREEGFQSVSLGLNRLRTETAALYALSIIKSGFGY